MKRTIKHLLSAFSICLFLFLAYGSGDSDSGTPEKKTSVSKAEAKVVAEGQVETLLKSPSTAKFSSWGDTQMTPKGNGFIVSGYVDSQNGFGAMIRSKYSVEIFVDVATGDIMYRNLKVE